MLILTTVHAKKISVSSPSSKKLIIFPKSIQLLYAVHETTRCIARKRKTRIFRMTLQNFTYSCAPQCKLLF